MNRYDPEVPPTGVEWLELDEWARLDLVAAYHRRKRVRLPNANLHATIHVIVENQLALGEKVVVATLARLVADGLDRHEAIHAIGSVLAEHVYDLMRDQSAVKSDAYADYLERLQGLTVATWRQGSQ